MQQEQTLNKIRDKIWLIGVRVCMRLCRVIVQGRGVIFVKLQFVLSDVASCSVCARKKRVRKFSRLCYRFSTSMSTGVYQKQSTPHLTRRDRSAEVCRRLHRRLAGSRRLDLRRRRTSGARCVQRRCRSPPVGRRRTSRGRSYTLRTLGRWQRGRKINRSRDTHGHLSPSTCAWFPSPLSQSDPQSHMVSLSFLLSGFCNYL